MDQNIFISNASNNGVDTTKNREILVDKFKIIHESVDCAHWEADAYHMANHILLNHTISGPIVEFGCFKGGMSAKLSLVAELIDRQYIIFDTFEGLPSNAIYKMWDESVADAVLKKNDYAASFEEVVQNINDFGSLKSCRFVKGLIEHTLPDFDENPSFVFIDVDIVETAQFIIKHLWHKLQGHLLYTHESCIKDYMNRIMDENWWHKNLECDPPQLGSALFNSGYSLENSACLDCLIKY